MADGPEAKDLLGVESVSMPRGWISSGMDNTVLVGASSPDYGFTEVVVSSNREAETMSTQDAAEHFVEVFEPNPSDLEYLDPVTVDGEELFHLRARRMSLGVEALGLERDGRFIFFAFYFNSEILPEGFEEETVAQVMRSVTFTAQG